MFPAPQPSPLILRSTRFNSSFPPHHVYCGPHWRLWCGSWKPAVIPPRNPKYTPSPDLKYAYDCWTPSDNPWTSFAQEATTWRRLKEALERARHRIGWSSPAVLFCVSSSVRVMRQWIGRLASRAQSSFFNPARQEVRWSYCELEALHVVRTLKAQTGSL